MTLNENIDQAVTMYMLEAGLNPAYKAFEYYQIALVHMIKTHDRYLRRQGELFEYVGSKCRSSKPVMIGRSMDRFARKLGLKTSALLQKCYLEILLQDD